MSESISTEPTVFDKKPMVISLEAGNYHWCSCGLSANQPFCDGGHKGTTFTPVTFELAEPKQVALCLCKHSGNAPFCDGAHTKL
ncbi:MAG: CDGSH iron-sulfur domain-containing protein [Microcoleus sp. PH2017_29_MFU_D_A]|jgi:CDGSH iron-sulfur domain-containing protein 3|uniref:CDGSH iron-sulfur domain-containing protein n=1 Tax=unclassified Microcoleus TaxID=2642155 RepID=UPI001DD2ADC0|nr:MULTISPECIES: CDGSH iron-sulfur domain-containing protein [unclassified Microcoleus]MCC3429421.1 CDGSH iron-sulfur domain-containing protein [Microcoleus sp. PH2017_04_SCI_O_A]MCC3441722.1 CDGSH iron-sulfur domain-containing protein [Microcoleus sp. PH2017_03_ELD_O_A]MCC3467282.1 CDGSH iron-sulfur domain-containing protein [Microcoleus sp. PH2017_06_SFM_O_A]MCC3506694.1 CDGSH iron-sulfur domain-containing protein [Microcoleus sp. PH2017_19_SFW_U_A]MCC3511629.1 CDGSH iron-sulfur domain-conta